MDFSKSWGIVLGKLRRGGEGKCCDTDLSLCLFGSFPSYLTHIALTNTASVLTGKFTNNHSFITWSCCKTPYGLLNLTVVHLSRDFEAETLQNAHEFSLTLWELGGRSRVKEDTVLGVRCVCACVHTRACIHFTVLKHLLLPNPKLECSGKDNLIFSFWIHFSDGNFNTSWGESIGGYVHQMQQ